MRRRTKALALFAVGALTVFVGVPVLQIVRASLEEEEVVEGPPVRVAAPQLRTLRQTVRYSGTLVAERSAAAIARLPGEVLEIPVSANDTVEAGDVIAEIEDDSARLELEQARANLETRESQLRAARRGPREEEVENARAEVEQAEEEIEVAESDLERTRRLYDAGTISRSRLEEAENAFRRAQTELSNAQRSLRMLEQGATDEEIEQAESAVRAAERQVELAELQLRYTVVRAPVSGRITSVEVEEGTTVDSGTPVAIIVNDDLVRARIRVPERRYAEFTSPELLSETQLNAAAYPGIEPHTAQITRIGSTIDPGSRTFEVELTADNSDGSLRPGMYVEATFTVRESVDALSVPDSAVVNRAGRHLVFVVVDDLVREVEVERGVRSGGYTEIRGDIDDDSQIVVEGNAFLEDDQYVRIVEQR